MDIRYVSRNVDLSDAVKDHMEKKLGKLEKFFERILSSQVEMSFSRGMFVVEITSDVNGVVMRGEDHANDLRKAFDRSLKNIERQVKRHKEYLTDRAQMKTHDVSFEIFDAEELMGELQSPQSAEAEDIDAIVKIKRFPMRPMSAQEATMQMDLLGHSFFVFRNADEGDGINVVYRRRSGGYGLITPEI
ncbi:ribosome-associated translation inhibitor RaiA [Aminithiophilus ramosus]|uniref:Ribosome hibernation promoting factor n=1 Tax=Aminithiophilus ramosus TaxID=3029084 RepID=A0A9Q7AA07_9BACT|nr:ribosome-associated translation inhibitor RaiA [Aminithiophilus ramosus]QTX33016.1 ribosome-associated translation inhibitor RaiA [Aminithiophilus ramosus]